ncbi:MULTISPECIES: MerR family transcriptional regulator [Vibrio]|uniref:MerR family transcriptional regulator n=3 Tax=Vibrio cyclitrophicus TaxID=47951 RepID=A0A7Z1S0Z5_9VIBR|nr:MULTISPECIES: MerR family transcriptional regulator [Vibrio]MBE8558093.1 MerR family transcriptional regulator [Vibrio sp. OPT24]MBU2932109.1 MerR family transcriptional regulator [Vibrio cyclitrophicus]MDH5878214.1 MerR family transcriptional regulator [Vibrio sp. S/42/10]NOH17425.1 MerR family transcriptional regulator [Vibrio cyclitrophicus]NOH42745.1 MerR family transcriptional regulator [Vibrio cyclitrophicus]
MLSIKQFCEQLEVCRTTVLYYERKGLITPAARASNGYRQYGERELDRFRSILAYRSYGIPVSEIESLLQQSQDEDRDVVLRQQFAALDLEIQKLRQQQQSIMALLKDPELLNQGLLTKERWTEILKESGMDEQGMINWHKRFEQMEPLGHLKFLQSLNIDEDEIAQIRAWSRQS